MFNSSIQEILIRRRNSIIIPKPKVLNKKNTTNLIATINKNLETGFGYILSKDCLKELQYIDKDQLKDFYNTIVDALKKNLPQKRYTPMYKNFPSQVMSMDEAELYFNAIMHYTGDIIGKRITPVYEEQERNPLFENTDVTILKYADNLNLVEIYKNLILSKTSISQQDKEDIVTILFFSDITLTIQEDIPHKENLAFFSKILIERKKPLNTNWFKNATDILRLSVALSNGDVSLSEKTKFKNFKRYERRNILALLDILDNSNIIQDMARHKQQWIKLGEKLHPGDYKEKYPNASYYFDMIRNHKVQTTNGLIDSAMKSGDIEFVVSELKRVPGEFVRKLDKLLRENNKTNQEYILKELKDVLDKVSTPVLLQVYHHFSTRDRNPYRVFLPKGNVQKAYIIENDLKPISIETVDFVLKNIWKTLIDRFSKLESLGKVYLDENLSQYTVPFSQRSASKTLKTISRGSKFNFDNEKNLRFFISWREPKGIRTDIDLSAVYFDANWNNIGRVSYTNLRNNYSVHSGDLTSAPNGATEYVDLDIQKSINNKVRYVMTQVFCFTSTPFCDLPECNFGWMEREDLESGEIYESTTVKNDFDLSSNSRIALPIIIDLIKGEVIWCDISLKHDIKHNIGFSRGNRYGIYVGGNNVESNIDTITAMGIAMTNLEKPNLLFPLLLLHSTSRGSFVDNPEDADTIFSEDQGTHFQLDKIMNEFLT
jgi:hypothetical protein